MKAVHATWLLVALQLATTVSASYKIVDLLSTDPAFGKLLRHLQQNRLVPILNNLPAVTLFAPTNNAFQKWDDEGRVITRDILLYHILPETILTDQFKDGQLLETMLIKAGYLGDNNEGQRVAVAKQSWRPGRRSAWTIGDAELLKKDWLSSNGAIQVVDRVLVPPKDIVDTLKMHAELQHVVDVLQGADLEGLLKRHQPFTMFAPTRDALGKLNPVHIQYLQHEQGKDDLNLTVQHHLHSGVLYRQDFAPGSSGVSTIEGQDLVVLNVDNKLMVDNAEVVQRDILASNGVIHTVSRPLLPSSLVWTAAKYLIGSNATHFVQALRDAHLDRYIDDPNASYTIFAVRDEDEPESFWSSLASVGSGSSRDLLQYHIVRGQLTLDDLKDGQLLKTELSTFELNEHAQRSKLTIQQSRRQKHMFLNGVEIVGEPLQMGKSMIYFISRPLELPPKLVKAMKFDGSLSLYSKALTETGLGRRLSDARGVTVFAPNDAAWEGLGVVSNYLMAKSSAEQLEQVLWYTVGSHVLYSSDIKQGRTKLKTAADEILVLEKAKDDVIYVGEGQVDQYAPISGRVVQRDLLVDSGVIHKVSSVALPPSLEITLYNVLQGAGTHTFLSAFESANITRILKDWDQDYTIFAPSDKAFEAPGLSGALLDRDFVARLVRLHVVPGKIIRLEEDIDVDEASLLNNDAKLSFRDVHGDGKSFGVRVKGARSSKEAKVIGFGRAHPSHPTDNGGSESLGTKPWRPATAIQQQQYGVDGFFEPGGTHDARHGGAVYVIDRVLLPNDGFRLGLAWIWISIAVLALIVAIILLSHTALGIHALLQEIRRLEGYEQVPQDEEAAVGSGVAAEEAAVGNGVVAEEVAVGNGVAAEEAAAVATPATADREVEGVIIGTETTNASPATADGAVTSGEVREQQ
ncbi:hypothetical protein BGZ73_003535 [Actinomortierella ambigua]|nr:hypothetical protein BGZ73_003535 [Actinomortierella ambigua]